MTIEGQTWFPKCDVPEDAGIKDGDLFYADGYRYEHDGRVHRCPLGEETVFRAVVKRGA